MMRPRSLLAIAALFALPVGLWLWWRSAGHPGAPRSGGLDGQRGLDPLDQQLRVVQRFAPVFLQKRKPKRARTDDGQAYEDHFVRVDYDGDWSGFDNSANLKEAKAQGRDLTAHVYYGVQETERYYYLHFAYFHPRDPKWLGCHENDLEGGMVVVKKAASSSEQLIRSQLVMVQAQAHNRYAYRNAKDLCVTAIADPIREADCGEGSDQEKTHPILVSQAGHGPPWNHGHGTEIPGSKRSLPKRALVYVPGDTPGLPTMPPERAVPYQLISLTGDRDGDGQLDVDPRTGVPSDPGLWDRRFDTRIYGRAAEYPPMSSGQRVGHALQSADGCKANLPWGWHGVESNVPQGMFFLDPAHAQARVKLAQYGVQEPPATTYVSNVYLEGARIPGTFPLLQMPDFKCDCAHMMTVFASSTALGMEPLEPGPGCSLVELEAPRALTPRAPRATRWSTCEELADWIHPEERDAVESVGPPSDASCALLVREGTYLRLPLQAAGIPFGETNRLPRLFNPEHYSAVRVIARAAASNPNFDLGGFWLHRAGNYDESMATVPFFARQRLAAGRWQDVVLSLGESPHFRSGDDVVLLALGPDVAARFAIASTESETLESGDVEIDSIELVPTRTARGLEVAAPPLAVTGIEPGRASFGDQMTIRGNGFATEQCALNFVTFGDSILKILGCSASTLTVEANGVGEATVRVQSSGGRVAESEEKLVIQVEP